MSFRDLSSWQKFSFYAIDLTKNKPLCCHLTKNNDSKKSFGVFGHYYEYLDFPSQRTHLN